MQPGDPDQEQTGADHPCLRDLPATGGTLSSGVKGRGGSRRETNNRALTPWLGISFQDAPEG